MLRIGVVLGLCVAAGCASHRGPATMARPLMLTEWWPLTTRLSAHVERDSVPVPPERLGVLERSFHRSPSGDRWLYVSDSTELLAHGHWGCGDREIAYRLAFQVTVPTRRRAAIVRSGVIASRTECEKGNAEYAKAMRELADQAHWSLRAILDRPKISSDSLARSQGRPPSHPSTAPSPKPRQPS